MHSGSLAIKGNNQTVLIIFTALRIVLINISIKVVFKTLPVGKVLICKCYYVMKLFDLYTMYNMYILVFAVTPI